MADGRSCILSQTSSRQRYTDRKHHMADSLEMVYRSHHATKRGEDFVLLGDTRGAFLKKTIGNNKRILDIGCRDGALTRSYVHGNEVLGVDIDSEALTRAQSELGIKTQRFDLNGPWNVRAHSYDVVVACEVLEHLYYPEQVLTRIATALTPNGVLVGSIPSAFSLRHRLRYLQATKAHTPLADPTHINHFSVKEFTSLLAERFERVEVVGYGKLGWLAEAFPQTFAYGLLFAASRPRTI